MTPTPSALDRQIAVPALLAEHADCLIVAGLAGTARDIAALTDDGAHTFVMAGAMGAACMIGFGLALAQPERRVVVVTGDGELLMNVGSLATIGVHNPRNLAIVCVDNGLYGETGNQRSHTSFGVDLEQMARASGIAATRTIDRMEQIDDGRQLLRDHNGTRFVRLRVGPGNAPKVRRLMEPSASRYRFRTALLGKP